MSTPQSWIEKAIERARKHSQELAHGYGVSESAVVWMGGNKYIVVKDGKAIYI